MVSSSDGHSLLRVSLVLGCLVATAQSFNLPQKTPISRPTATATSLLRGPLLSRDRFQQPFPRTSQVVKQSTCPLEQPGFFTDEQETATRPFEISSTRLRLEQRRRAAVAASPQTSDPKKATATVVSSTMSLVKVVLGTGVLTLPYGVAAVSDYPVAYVAYLVGSWIVSCFA